MGREREGKRKGKRKGERRKRKGKRKGERRKGKRKGERRKRKGKRERRKRREREGERISINNEGNRMQERANQLKQKIGYNFDVTKHIRLVPPFQEKEVDKYFLNFEKVAENLNWPKEYWTLLLQSVLMGKAHEIYIQLGVEPSHHYETVNSLPNDPDF